MSWSEQTLDRLGVGQRATSAGDPLGGGFLDRAGIGAVRQRRIVCRRELHAGRLGERSLAGGGRNRLALGLPCQVVLAWISVESTAHGRLL